MSRTLDQLRHEVYHAVQTALSRTTCQFTAYAGGEWYAAPDVPGVRLRIEWEIAPKALSHQPSLCGGAEADEEGGEA